MKEAQRREERRADIRLQGGLQRLDEARSYHINTLTREQRKLQTDLLNMKTGNPWRRNSKPLWSQPFNPDPTLSVPYRTTLPKIPRTKREPERHSPPPSPSLTAPLAPDGRPRTMHILPDFNQSLVEARKARYIRHRGRPPCEKELSIPEIFACSDTDSAYRY
ncbi:uncharacterized protein ccdc190 [Aplochiton taeniatus]